MTLNELVERLQKLQSNFGETEVMLMDSHNGGGQPRTINLGPTFHVITRQDAMETADCEDRAEQKVVVLGFGCY